MPYAQSRARKNQHIPNDGTTSCLHELHSQIAGLQAEFQHIADLHPWVCLGVPTRGALSIGELVMPSKRPPRPLSKILDADGKPLKIPKPSLEEQAAYCKNARAFRFVGADGEIEPSIEMVAKAIQDLEKLHNMDYELYGPPPWVMPPQDSMRGPVVEHVKELTWTASQLLLRVLDGANHIHEDIQQEIRKHKGVTNEYGWLTWLRCSVVINGPINRIKNYPQVAATGLMNLREAIGPEIPVVRSKEECTARPVDEMPNFEDWAAALTETGKWVLFKREGDKWHHHGKVQVSKGHQDKLLNAFLQGKGRLSKKDALAAVGFHLPSGLREKEKNRMASEGINPINLGTEARRAVRNLRPELSNIRKAVRSAMGIPHSVADPFPKNGSNGWTAAINLGYASNDDYGKLRFWTPDQKLNG